MRQSPSKNSQFLIWTRSSKHDILILPTSIFIRSGSAQLSRFECRSKKSALYQDSFHHNLTTLLRYGDRNSMAHSREVRLPFCDHRIAEFVLKLPPSMLMGHTQTKRLLRESMSGLIPTEIQQRWNKQGFFTNLCTENKDE